MLLPKRSVQSWPDKPLHNAAPSMYSDTAQPDRSGGDRFRSGLYATAGQFRVDGIGTARPIAFPLRPRRVRRVSLRKSASIIPAQGGNGLIGKGWGISGLSGITRCRQTLQQDGAAKPAITWSSQDRFCLDGRGVSDPCIWQLWCRKCCL